MSVTDVVERLRAIQAVDSGIKALEDELELLPRNLETARRDLATVEERLTAGQAVLDDIHKRRRALEQEIADADQKVITYENQKLKVKTNVEYQALNSQIAHERDRKSHLEDQVLATYDEEAAAGARQKRIQDEIKLVREAVAARESELKTRSEEDRKRLEELRGGRPPLLEGVDPRLMARYEQLRDHKGGTAVVPIVRGACGGCFTQQPPQKLNEVRKEDALHTCEFCGRFLVWESEEAPAS